MATFRISVLLPIESWTFWYIERRSTSLYTDVIRFQKWSGFLAHPVESLKTLFQNWSVVISSQSNDLSTSVPRWSASPMATVCSSLSPSSESESEYSSCFLDFFLGGHDQSAELSKVGYKCGYTHCTRTRSVVPEPARTRKMSTRPGTGIPAQPYRYGVITQPEVVRLGLNLVGWCKMRCRCRKQNEIKSGRRIPLWQPSDFRNRQ